MEESFKGEARRLADIFSTEDTQKASLHVKNAIDSQKHTLHTLKGFAQENEELMKLVGDLPNKISHSIMVPFGKLAFFPGRLVHTNEILVLLGESYYAECSAKQTVDILDRRGKLLNSRIEDVQSQLDDLNVESRFFNETLADAAAGVVDIREEFVESGSMSKSSPERLQNQEERSLPVFSKDEMDHSVFYSKDEDKEYELLMARLEELEAAEAAAEALENQNEDKFPELISEIKDHDRMTTKGRNTKEKIYDQSKDISKINKEISGIHITCERPDLRSPGDLLKFEEWKRTNRTKGGGNVTMEDEILSTPKEVDKKQLHESNFQKSSEASISEITEKSGIPKRKEVSSSNKSFTGTVLERTESIPEVPKGPNEIQNKPLSKFKMRQAQR